MRRRAAEFYPQMEADGRRWGEESEASEPTTEMTVTNCTLDATRNGPEKPRQLLRKERLADVNQFLLLTAHANG